MSNHRAVTTEVYGHLSANYLKREIERLSFGPPPADDAKSLLLAGADSEPPRLADTRAKERVCGSVSDYPATTRSPSGALGAPSAPNGRYGISRA